MVDYPVRKLFNHKKYLLNHPPSKNKKNTNWLVVND